MEAVKTILIPIKSLLDTPLVPIGGTNFTLWMLLYLVILLALLVYFSGRLKFWLIDRLLAHTSVDIGVRQAVGSILRYAIIAVGFVIILQTAGIDLSALTVLAGALGIGVGLGLQNIASNFISGLIILFERPIKVGDRVEVGGITGNVVQISPRATIVVSNDNIAIIVPNSQFVTSSVINWSYTDRDVRFNVPVGVSYSSDPQEIKKLLLEIAAEHSGVLKQPEPDVLFQEFGDSSLNFVLRVWTRDYTSRPGVIRSDLNYAISKKFKERGVEIPFPQRDLHIRSSAVEFTASTPK
jgi:small-conductance mechanosensitive channel